MRRALWLLPIAAVVLLAFGYGLKQGAKTPEQVFYLSDFEPLRTGNLYGGLGRDRPPWQKRFLISGRKFRKGLVTAPNTNAPRAFVEYQLDRRYLRFKATLGRAQAGTAYGKTHMSYHVLVDGKEAAQGPVPLPPETVELDVRVKGTKVLRLEVDCGDDGNAMDTAAWGNARVVR
jgi:hypothetical protein